MTEPTRWTIDLTLADGRTVRRVVDFGDRKGTRLTALHACTQAAGMCWGLDVREVVVTADTGTGDPHPLPPACDGAATVTLRPAAIGDEVDPRPFAVRLRLGLKHLLRHCGVRASWPRVPYVPPPGPERKRRAKKETPC